MSKTLHYRACHLCEAICGLAIETESDEGGVPRIRSIKGDPQDSFSRGHVCPKAVALQDIQDDPDRLRQPLRRVGSEWQPIGWDEAFALVASRLGEIRERHGNDAVAVYQGNPSVHNYGLMTHSNYFLGLLKTRNRFSATSVDQLPHHLVSQQMYGHGLLIPIPDIDHTDFMLVLGGNPLASNGSISDRAGRGEAPEGAEGTRRPVGGGRSPAQRDRGYRRPAPVHSSRPGCGAVARDTQHPVRGEPRSPHAAAGRRAGAGARGGRGLRRRVHERALWRAGRKHSPTGAGFSPPPNGRSAMAGWAFPPRPSARSASGWCN